MLVINHFLPQSNLSIFDEPSFFKLHLGADTGFYFQWVKKGKPVAGAHFVESSLGDFRSPRRGTYGGIFIENSISAGEIRDMMVGIIEHLRENGAKSIHMALAPEWHDPQHFSSCTYALHSLGFHLSRCDLDFGRIVSEVPFLHATSPDVRRRNSSDEAKMFVTRKLESAEFSRAYEFIALHHADKGYPVSMSLQQLEEMRQTFPLSISSFAAEQNGEIVAAAVCILIRKSMQHIFLMNNKSCATKCNTVALVVEKIYDDCLSMGITSLSYGIATENRNMNEGLIGFKRSLGFVESAKLGFTLTL